MVSIKDGKLTKIAESKIAGAIYKVIRTSQDDYALACSNGLYFADYDNRHKKFFIAKEFFLSDLVVTQVVEVSNKETMTSRLTRWSDRGKKPVRKS